MGILCEYIQEALSFSIQGSSMKRDQSTLENLPAQNHHQ